MEIKIDQLGIIAVAHPGLFKHNVQPLGLWPWDLGFPWARALVHCDKASLPDRSYFHNYQIRNIKSSPLMTLSFHMYDTSNTQVTCHHHRKHIDDFHHLKYM